MLDLPLRLTSPPLPPRPQRRQEVFIRFLILDIELLRVGCSMFAVFASPQANLKTA